MFSFSVSSRANMLSDDPAKLVKLGDRSCTYLVTAARTTLLEGDTEVASGTYESMRAAQRLLQGGNW